MHKIFHVVSWAVLFRIDAYDRDSTVSVFMFTPMCVGTEMTCGWPGGVSMDVAIQLLVEKVNQNRFMAGNKTLIVTVKDTQCSGGVGQKTGANMLLQKPRSEWPFGVVACGCSGCTMAVQPLLNIARIPMVSHTATNTDLSNRNAYPNFFRIMPTDATAIKVWFALFKAWGWLRFAAFYEVEFGIGLRNTVRAIIKDYNGVMIDVLEDQQEIAVMSDFAPETARLLLETILKTRTRAIMSVAYEAYRRQFMCQQVQRKIRGMYTIGFGWFGANWWTKDIAGHVCTKNEMDTAALFLMSATGTIWGAGLNPCLGSFTVEDFQKEYKIRRAATAGAPNGQGEAGYAADALCLILLGYNELIKQGFEPSSVHNMNASTYKAYSSHIQNLEVNGISGPISYLKDPTKEMAGDRIAPFTIRQNIDGILYDMAEASEQGDGSVDIKFSATNSFQFDEGFTLASTPPNLYKSCKVGTVYNYQAATCEGCAAQREFVQKSASCECVPGTFENQTGMCQPCSAGKFSKTAGSIRCSNCTLGKYSIANLPKCNMCPLGRYGSKHGLAQCTHCPDVMTTLAFGSEQQSECMCPEGFYMPQGRSTCSPCPQGLQCETSSAAENFPTARGGSSPCTKGEGRCAFPVPMAGFFSLSTSPLIAYKCLSTDSCPGKHIETCANNLEGVACGRCRTGYYKDGAGCVKCSPEHASGGMFPTIPILLGLPIVTVLYKFGRDPVQKWGGKSSSINAVVTTTLVYAQTLAVIQSCGIQAAPEYSSNMNWITNVNDIMSIFKPSCYGWQDFSIRFIGKMMLPLFALSFFVGAFVLSFGFSKFKPELLMEKNVLFSVYGGVFTCFNINIMTQAFSLLQCYPHPPPNTERSMRLSPDVLCGGNVWTALLGAAVPAILIFCLGYLVTISWAIYKAPRAFHLVFFRTRWKFLFIKFRPSSWWWSLVLFGKSTPLGLTTVVLTKGDEQTLWIGFVVVIYALASCFLLPWRSITASCADIVFHGFLAVMIMLLTSTANVGAFAVVFACFPFAISALCIGLIARQTKTAQEKIQELEQIVSRFQSFGFDAEGTASMCQLPFLDVFTLKQSAAILARELGGEAQSGSLQRLSSRTLSSGKSKAAGRTVFVEV